MKTVTSRRNALVSRFRSALRANRRERTHLLLDGRRLIGDARRAGAAVETVVVTAAAVRRGDPALADVFDQVEYPGVGVRRCPAGSVDEAHFTLP